MRGYEWGLDRGPRRAVVPQDDHRRAPAYCRVQGGQQTPEFMVGRLDRSLVSGGVTVDLLVVQGRRRLVERGVGGVKG